jgi:6-phosphogluconate dehydrogenase
MLEQWFPDAPCTKYSLAWYDSGSNANECQALLESHRDVISDKGYQDLKRDGVFFRGPVVRCCR